MYLYVVTIMILNTLLFLYVCMLEIKLISFKYSVIEYISIFLQNICKPI